MQLHFTKMHGLGNDFMVIDGVSRHVQLSEEQILKLSDRNTGVGFDQLLLVEPPKKAHEDFHYRIFNADGSEVEQCGNGARCFAVFVQRTGLTPKDKIIVSTKSGVIELNVSKNGLVTVDMGVPSFEPESLPFLAPEKQQQYNIEVDGKTYQVSAVSMGNPHCVVQVDRIDTDLVQTLGPKLVAHPMFPNQVNVGFMQIVDRKYVRLRVYERGAGETMACGTGACAAACAGINLDLLDNDVKVRLTGGNLRISWAGHGHSVKMTGPAETVYEGRVSL